MTWHNRFSQTSIYVDNKNLGWLKAQVKAGNFENVSDGIRKCVAEMRNRSRKQQ